MKKIVTLFLLSIFSLLISCELFIFPSEYYFWSLAEDYDNNDGEPLILEYRADLKFIMTRGEDNGETPGYSTEEEAESAKEITSFTLSETTNHLKFDNSSNPITVKALASNTEEGNFHVFQIYLIRNIIKDEIYEITGKTLENGQPLVKSKTIKVVFK